MYEDSWRDMKAELIIPIDSLYFLTIQSDQVGVYKIIENDHVIIIRNGERYDITGKKL